MTIRDKHEKLGAVSTVVAVLLLTACNAGEILEGAVDAVQRENLERKDKNQSDLVELTGASSPQEPAWDQRQRSSSIRGRSNSFVLSSVYGEGFPPGDTDPVKWQSACAGNRCTVRNPDTDVSNTFGKDGRYPSPDADDPVLTRHGITTMYSSKTIGGYEHRSYGAWLHHSTFTVGTGKFSKSFDDPNFILFSTFRRGLASGQLTGSRPSARAIWRGLMVGMPQRGAYRHHFLQGDATLIFELGEGSIDAVFEDIKDLDRQTDYAIPSIRFHDVPVTGQGDFSDVQPDGVRIQGGFYGPGHVETAGVFEHSGIVGAFGARKP